MGFGVVGVSLVADMKIKVRRSVMARAPWADGSGRLAGLVLGPCGDRS